MPPGFSAQGQTSGLEPRPQALCPHPASWPSWPWVFRGITVSLERPPAVGREPSGAWLRPREPGSAHASRRDLGWGGGQVP